MYELSRVRLHSVGPKGARYQDVVLDLREVGRPVPRPTQNALFGPEPAVPRRRPSPASVLFAENGNGKSVLIKLIFSVMLPGRRQVVGTTSSRVLENFVLAADVAFVGLEWQHTQTGERVVTGKLSAWNGHTVSTDSNKLAQVWFSFRPTQAFNLDSLPLMQDGRLVSLHGLHDRFSEAERHEPGIRLVWESKSHTDWLEHLENLGLDPELFAYQRKMNAGEGEAADAFTFKSDEAFVDWLLTVVTDDEEPREVAGVLNGYATTLARRGAISAEREFVDGALSRLEPLAVAARDTAAARQILVEETRKAREFTTKVQVRLRQEEALAEILGGRSDVLGAEVEAAERDSRRLNAILLEIRRLVAGFLLKQAEDRRARLEEELQGANLTLAAWQATKIVLTARSAQERARTLREVVTLQEEEAAPVLAARDLAGRRLVQGLLAIAAEADDRASNARAEAAQLEQQAKDQDAKERKYLRLAERELAAEQAARAKFNAAQKVLTEAVSNGLLTKNADPEQAAVASRTRAEESNRAFEEILRENTRLISARQQASTALLATQTEQNRQAQLLETAETQQRDAVVATEDLASQERLAEVLGVESVDLDTDAESAQERLAAVVRDNGQQVSLLRMDFQEDQRVMEALGSGGLLPAPHDVASVQETLRSAGITSYTGWQFLAQMPGDERDRALSRYPQLVDGIVLNKASQLERAQELLIQARLLPRSVVAVGATQAISAMADAPDLQGVAFLVPPNPAMYDEAQAEKERVALQQVQRQRQEQIDQIDERIQADQQLSAKLGHWQTSYPPGTLARLAAAVAEAREAHEDAVEKAAQAESALAEVDEQIQVLSERLPVARDAHEMARHEAEELNRLVEQVSKVPEWVEAERLARESAQKAEAAARTAQESSERLVKRGQESIRQGDEHTRTAGSCREEVSQIPGGGSAEAGEKPVEPVATLRTVYLTVVEAYRRVQVGEDLRREVDEADQRESEARSQVEQLPAEVRTRSEDTLLSPDGADAASRAAATSRAGRAVRGLEEQIRDAGEEVGALRSEYKKMQPQDRSLDPYGAPHDIAHGERLIAHVESDWKQARSLHTDLTSRHQELAEQKHVIDRSVEVFGSILIAMGEHPTEADSDGDEPFAGTVEQARARADAVREAKAQAQQLLDDNEKVLQRLTSAFHRYAIDERFEHVDSPVRRQILATNLEKLPEYSVDWEQALRPRLRTLNDDLAQIDRHRNQIIIQLRALVMNALARLRSAERVSALPASLGDWAGQKFLRIRFQDPDPAELDVRLGQVIDELAAINPGAERAGRKRDGITLLLRGVRAALPKGVKVDLLKPDASLHTERIRIAQVNDVFSGGQLLTAAIILYCTMAALRANEQGHARRPHAGVLFLDNPIGRASASYLLDLQLGVAEALGVQLVYTTGLFDVNALASFPLIIRLRNDRDIRSGMKYLVVEDEIRHQLDGLGEPDDAGRISAARLFRRPQEVEAGA